MLIKSKPNDLVKNINIFNEEMPVTYWEGGDCHLLNCFWKENAKVIY